MTPEEIKAISNGKFWFLRQWIRVCKTCEFRIGGGCSWHKGQEFHDSHTCKHWRSKWLADKKRKESEETDDT